MIRIDWASLIDFLCSKTSFYPVLSYYKANQCNFQICCTMIRLGCTCPSFSLCSTKPIIMSYKTFFIHIVQFINVIFRFLYKDQTRLSLSFVIYQCSESIPFSYGLSDIKVYTICSDLSFPILRKDTVLYQWIKCVGFVYFVSSVSENMARNLCLKVCIFIISQVASCLCVTWCSDFGGIVEDIIHFLRGALHINIKF